MQEKNIKWRWYRPLQIVILITFVITVGIIAVFPFPDRNLNMAFIDGDKQYTVYLAKDAIIQGDCTEIILRNVNKNTAISKIRVYGTHKSLRLWEMDSSSFYYNFYEELSAADIVLEGTDLILPEETVKIKFGDSFTKQMKNLSQSFLQERLIYAELAGFLAMLLLMLITVVRDWKDGNRLDNHSPLYECVKFVGDMHKYSQYMVYAAKADLRAEVANSYLNRLWWLLEPFFSMLVYVVVFGNVLGRSVENYATFIFSALLMWSFFNKTLNYSVKLVRYNRDIITKVYVPKFILLFSNMILNLYKLVFSLIVLVPMLVIFRVQIGSNIVWVIPAFATLILFSFGVGMILLHYGVYIDDLGYAVGILLSMMMFLSGTFYDVMTGLSYPLNALMLCLNPVAMCTDTMRSALLYNTAANLPLVGVWFLISLIVCWMGVHIVYKNENSYVKIV